jgi:hypothetical protein
VATVAVLLDERHVGAAISVEIAERTLRQRLRHERAERPRDPGLAPDGAGQDEHAERDTWKAFRG